MRLPRSSGWHSRWGRRDDGGFALPLALFLLAIAAVLTGAALYAAMSVAQRERADEDAAQAFDLARSGAEAGIARALLDERAGTADGSVGAGHYQVSVQPDAAAGYFDIASKGWTPAGGRASVRAVVYAPNRQLTTWSQQP